MTQASTTTSAPLAPVAPAPKASAGSNVYTVLALISALALGGAVGFVAWKNTQLTGNSNPFFVTPAPESGQ